MDSQEDESSSRNQGNVINNTSSGNRLKPSPSLSAGLFSKLTFWWVCSLVKLSNRRPLEVEDVYSLPPWARAGDNLSTFERRWTALSKSEKDKRGSLIMQLLLHFKGQIVCILLLEFVLESIKFLQPLVTAALIVRVSEEKGNLSPLTYVYWAILMVSILAISIMNNHMNNGYDCIAMGMRTTCSAMIYKKVLTMSHQAHRLNKSGHIVSLMSTDVEAFIDSIQNLHGIIFGPLWIIMFFASQVGHSWVSTLACVFLIFIVMLIQHVNAKTLGKLRLQKEQETSKRVHFMSEVVSSMRGIKMYCWEKPIAVKAKELRQSEMKINKERLTRQATCAGVNLSMANIMIFSMITLRFLSGIEINPADTIIIIGGINAMKSLALVIFPYAFIMLYEVLASSERIKEYLLSEDIVEDFMFALEKETRANISLTNASAAWDQEVNNSEKGISYTFQNANFKASTGQLIGITGKVGSGKSSLLMALIGELPLLEGSRRVQGSVAYVPQQSWVMSETVRKNVILECDFEEKKYKTVMAACSLDLDMEQLPDGDLTLVGERGLSLSGGQRSRLNLARAVYQEADIYIFDDPFAAVDTKVGKQIFDMCINKLLRGKLRILVTHHLQYLSQVDKLLVMDKGKIIHSCEHHRVRQALKRYDRGELQTRRKISIDEGYEMPAENDDDPSSRQLPSAASQSIENDTRTEEKAFADKEEGEISMDTYMKFLKSGKAFAPLACTMLFLILLMITDVTSSWLLSIWDSRKINVSANYTEEKGFLPVDEDTSYLLLVGGTVLSIIISAIAFQNSIAWVVNLCSQRLYNNMFDVVLRAPIHFFERNPVGQILNRFSRDIGFIDYTLTSPVGQTLKVFGLAIAYLIYACVISPLMTIGAVVFLGLMMALFKYTMPSIRDLRRIEGTCRSPTYSHLSATLQGLPVIRAFRKQTQFLDDAFTYMDNHTAVWYLFLSTQRFLGVITSLMAAVFGMVYISVTVFAMDFEIGASGLSINYLVYVIGTWYYALTLMAEVQIGMTSVERILQFSNLEQEAPEHTELTPPPGWPSQGRIKIKDMCVTYRGQQRQALGPINVEIEPGEKVGVVGRTGAGKSSLFLGLLRIVEPTGSIEIDDLEITKMGLTDLRSKISVISQEPFLFSGSVRFNLDPFAEFHDSKLWAVLNQVQLASKVEVLTGDLSADMGEAGSSFSVGERQLLCMARALLRQNKIIIIDEATANVDNKTDAIIQETLMRGFADATVLTIAHRLNTIITYDKILVLDQGLCKEYGHPQNLLNNKLGMFQQMVDRFGPVLSAQLKKIALTSFMKLKQPQQLHDKLASNSNSLEEGKDQPPANITAVEIGRDNISYLKNE